MANQPNQKLRLLYLVRILMEKTDDVNGLTTQQLIEELAYYGVDAERKALYRDIRAMREFGLEVRQRGGKQWYLATRPLGLQEMILLVDAAQSSPFLTEEMTDGLIGRLQGLASEDQRKMLARRVEVPSRVKMRNQDVLHNLDVIQQALRLRRKVEFRYFHYDVAKQPVLNGEGRVYSVAPVRLVYADERYYLMSFMGEWADVEGHQPFAPYRVDRMVDVRVSDEPLPRDSRIAGYRTEDHLSSGFGVFAAEKVPVVLEFDQQAMNPIIDKFGLDAIVFEKEGGRAQAHVKAPLSPQFYGWLLQLGAMVRIVHPARAAQEFRQMLEQAQRMYQGGYRILSETGRDCITQEQFLQLVEELEAALRHQAGEGFASEWDFIRFAGDYVEEWLVARGVDDGMPRSVPEPRMVQGKLRTPPTPITVERYLAFGQVVGEAIIAVEPRRWAAPEAAAGFLDTAARYDASRGAKFTMQLPPRTMDWERAGGSRRWRLSGTACFERWSERGETGLAHRCRLVAPDLGVAELPLAPWLGATDGAATFKAVAKLWQRLAYRFS